MDVVHDTSQASSIEGIITHQRMSRAMFSDNIAYPFRRWLVASDSVRPDDEPPLCLKMLGKPVPTVGLFMRYGVIKTWLPRT